MTAFSEYSLWLASWMILGAFELNFGLRVLPVEARVDFFRGLIDRVLHFLQVDFADHVKAIVGCHGGSMGQAPQMLVFSEWLKRA